MSNDSDIQSNLNIVESDDYNSDRDNINNGIDKSIYNNIPQYSGDRDIQTLLDFIHKVDSYLTITDTIPSMEIALITMKLIGTASLLWRHHKRIYDMSSPHCIKTWKGLHHLLMQNKVTKEYEQYVLSQLDTLKQKDSVQKYTSDFECYTMQLIDLLLTIEMYYYLKGLKVEI